MTNSSTRSFSFGDSSESPFFLSSFIALFLLSVIFDYIIFIYDYFVNTFLLSLITFLLIFLFFSVILIANKEVTHVTQGERIKEVRNSLGLTLEKFGDRLGVTKVAISNIEKGNRNLTEQMTKSICREFGVDYMWLTTGEGEMFVETDDDFFERIDRIMAGENETRKNMFKALLYASDEDIEALARIIELFTNAKKD